MIILKRALNQGEHKIILQLCWIPLKVVLDFLMLMQNPILFVIFQKVKHTLLKN